MENRSEIREFLTARRAQVAPDQAGLPAYGRHRRVPGLRREEVAMLAGVSVDYYTRLERGDLSGASDSVLDALARALQLGDAERTHLYDLARAAASRDPRRQRPTIRKVSDSVQRVVDAISTPAWVRNGRSDVMATNLLGRALYSPLFDSPTATTRARHVHPNTARFAFLDPRAADFYVDWDRVATEKVGILRGEAGRHPHDKDLTDLVGELCTLSEDFRTRWARHDVRLHRTGRKSLHHPVVGDLDLTYEALELTSSPGQTLIVYTPLPDSATQDALALLASWAATTLSTAPTTPEMITQRTELT